MHNTVQLQEVKMCKIKNKYPVCRIVEAVHEYTRRWTNIKPALVQHDVFAGLYMYAANVSY